MACTITNLKELQARVFLKEDDVVVFNIEGERLEYKVRTNYLSLNETEYNHKVFDLLNLDRFAFATEHYGYTTHAGHWPQSNDKDFKALYRLVEALYKEIEPKSKYKVGDIWATISYGMQTLNKDNKPKLKTMCENITKFAKNMTLSADDKLYRKVGLQNEDGQWSEQADRIIVDTEAKELGFDDYEEVCSKHARCNSFSVFEMENMYAKHADSLKAIAVAYAKELDKKGK